MAEKKKVKAKKAKRICKRPRPKATARKKVVRKGKKGKSKKVIGKKTLEMTLEKVGEVTHYFPHVKAAAVLVLKDSLKVGEKIYIKGHTTDFKEKVNSIQLDHIPIQEGKKGQEIGLLVKSRVRIGDSVYRL